MGNVGLLLGGGQESLKGEAAARAAGAVLGCENLPRGFV